MKIEVKSWAMDLFSVEAGSLKRALEIAVSSGANLECANLRGANLRGANLRGANLRGARLETGETLDEYRRDIVPALLKAGGHPVPEQAWSCHSWTTCPMASAFAVDDYSKIPPLYRPRMEQFIRLFDAGIPVRPDGA